MNSSPSRIAQQFRLDTVNLAFSTLVCSPLVATEFGTGFLTHGGELRLMHGVHVSPLPQTLRAPSIEETRRWYETRRAIRREQAARYDRLTYTGD